MARQDFIDQLSAMGFSPEVIGENRVCFEYMIPVGKFAGQSIKLGFEVNGDFPANPPGGLHVTPHLLPMNNSSNIHPAGGIHPSQPFGPGWQYWSRPCPDWSKTDRTVRAYMAHIRHLFETQ